MFKESLVEVQRAINILEFMSGEGRRLGGQTLPSEDAENFCLHDQATARRGGSDYAVEFSGRDPCLEGGPGAGHGQYDGSEASGNYAADRYKNSRDFHAGRTASGSVEHSPWRRRGCGRRTRAASGRARHFFHGIE